MPRRTSAAQFTAARRFSARLATTMTRHALATHSLALIQQALAMVVRTGFRTAKGQLVRTILHAPTVEYIYEKEARVFLGLLAGVGATFFFLALWLWGAFREWHNIYLV